MARTGIDSAMKCFVIMPFGNPEIDPARAAKLDRIYSHWIKPAVESGSYGSVKITCHRADKSARPGDIITHIIENLVTSDIIIADLTDRNPNVFYELGVRHAVSNNTILIAENLDDIPFDLRALRTIVYRYEPEEMLKLKDVIEQSIKEVLAQPGKIDNPVRKFLYDQEVDRLVHQQVPPGYDVYKSLLSEISTLKADLRRYGSDVQHIMELVTASEKPDSPTGVRQPIDIDFFEGTWKNKISGSTYCARVMNGKLLIPYCYGGELELTGQYHNCRIIGDTLFARFEWFDSTIYGYAFLKIESEDTLVGGWWYGSDVPPEVHIDVSVVNESMPYMNKSLWTRVSRNQRFPSWAEDYFGQVLKNGDFRISRG